MATTVQGKRGWLAAASIVIATSSIKAWTQSAPVAYPVPFSTAIAGNGTAGATTASCGTLIDTTSGTDLGDGCPSATAAVNAPQGAAVDKYGNIYFADYGDRAVRVIYNGGAGVAAAITAANSGYSISAGHSAPAPTPVVGNIYTIAGLGSMTAAAALNVTSSDGSGKLACANYATSGQPDALNSLGDGCPAASAPIGPRDVSVDGDSNLFITDYTDSRIRVLCVNCAAGNLATQLIELEEPGVIPVNGAMYTIAGYAGGYRDGYLGFGNATIASTGVALLRSPTAAIVSNSDDVFIADNQNNAVRVLYNGGAPAKAILVAQGNASPQLGYVYTIAGTGCVSAATNKTGSVTTANSCLTTTGSDIAMLGNALGLNVAWTVYLDASSNVFYTDAGNARVKVIYGGVAAPLTFPTAAYTTLQAGYTYTFAGQGSATQSGVAPNQLALSSAQGVGGDSSGNIFFVDYNTSLFYETYAQTGLTAIIGGGNAIAAGSAAAFCNGGTAGPAMTDAFYDGCPLTQAKLANPRGPVVADAGGTLYFGDSVGSLMRKFSYNAVFPTTAVAASSAAQSYAFTFSAAKTLAATSFNLAGAAAAGFGDAGGDTCASGLAVAGGGPGTTCVVNAAFAPTRPGLAQGAIVINATAGPLGASFVSGTATGAGLAIDPAESTVTGTGLTPNGIAVDGAGRVLVTDTISKSLLRYTGGSAATILSGLNVPSGVATDGAGNLFIADSAANTVTEIPITGTKFTLTTAVNSPHGLATDGLGRLYVADAGNNRVLVFSPAALQPTVAAFTGLSAPQAVAIDAAGNLFVADASHVFKLTSAGVQTIIAGSGATGVAVDAAGNVLVTAGTSVLEYPASGAPAITLSTALTTPHALALDATGNAYIADSGLSGYLQLQRTAGAYTFSSSPSSATVYLSSIGNVALTAPITQQTDSADYSLAPATSNGCSGAIVSGTECSLTARFNPSVAGPVTDTVTFSSNAVNSSSATLTLTGMSSAQTTTTALAISPATLVYGSVETLTAVVNSALGAPASGTVNFYNQSALLGVASVNAGGVATLPFIPSAGSYGVTAVFEPETGGGYNTSSSTAQGFVVTPAPLTVTANSASKIAGTANPVFTYAVTGFVNNDMQVVLTGAPVEYTTAATASPVGAYPITIAPGTLAAANYTLIFVNGTLTVTGTTTQTIAFGALPATTYGAALITLAATASSQLPVSYTVSGPANVAGSVLTITGAGTVSVTANQVGNNTYAAATPAVQSFAVAQAPATVMAASVSRVYGSGNPALTYTINGLVNGDSAVTASSGTPAESITATIASGVGGYAIAITAGSLTSRNYLLSYSSGTLTVIPALLTVTAGNATRTYGVANPTFSGTLSGAVNSDMLTETFSTTAMTSSSAGTYAIVPGVSGAEGANYTLAATNGTLTVAKATPLILFTASAPSGYYGSTSITLTATLTSPTTGVPSQTVAFNSSAGIATTAAGTVTLANGIGVLPTTMLPVGVDTVTAAYGGDGNFASVTSSSIAITIAPAFSVVSTTTALAFQTSYQEAQSILTIAPGGRTDTLTFACQGLPAKLSCAFSPATLPLGGVTATQSVQLFVSNSSATAGLKAEPLASARRSTAWALMPLAAFLLLGKRRRRLPVLLSVALALFASASLSGCGSGPTSIEQSSGSYAFTVTVSSGSMVLTSIPYTLTIP